MCVNTVQISNNSNANFIDLYYFLAKKKLLLMVHKTVKTALESDELETNIHTPIDSQPDRTTNPNRAAVQELNTRTIINENNILVILIQSNPSIHPKNV